MRVRLLTLSNDSARVIPAKAGILLSLKTLGSRLRGNDGRQRLCRDAAMKVIGFIGYSNTGKTTLIEKLIPLFIARGLKVSTVKNAHHGFDMDRPGKDSYRYREAGSAQVLIATSGALGAAHRGARRAGAARRPDRAAGALRPGAGRGLQERGAVSAHRGPTRHQQRAADLSARPNVIAVASDHAVDTALPVLDLNDAAKIAAFIVDRLELA
jgi:molybdopterin-guanine dinucleotide biosynthesis adapter protein